MRRRDAIRNLSIPVVLGTTGCLWEDNSSDNPNQDGNGDGSTSDESGTSTAAESNTVEESSAFTNLEIDGTKFVVELEQNAVDEGDRITVEYPNDDDSKDISPGLTTYQFSLTNGEVIARPGTWDVSVQDGSRESIASSEFTAERNFEISNIATLAQAGTKDENERIEHTSLQMTLTNTGPMPVSIRNPRFDATFLNDDEYHSGDPSRVVMTAGEEETFAPMFREVLMSVVESEAEERAGNSYQGTFLYSYTPTGDHHIPLTIEFGEDYDNTGGLYYHIPTEVHIRDNT